MHARWLLYLAPVAISTACAHARPSDQASSSPPAGSAAPSPTDLDAATSMEEASAGDAQATVAMTEAGTVDAAPAVASTPEWSSPGYPAAALKATFEREQKKLLGCFEPGRKRNPQLRGRVIVRFTLGTNGRAKAVANQGSNLEDDAVIACVVKVVKASHFPPTQEGTVTVVYPFIFHPYEPFLILPESAPAPGQ